MDPPVRGLLECSATARSHFCTPQAASAADEQTEQTSKGQACEAETHHADPSKPARGRPE
jgi:hypothetical protein